ncbi:MAG: EAL domain-containing protein [Novosphingobium sp.]|nr:EAL domain-containing protein [Novosphingobium sp.]MCP5378822.1 EAL domain-containing protein [Novosphingobium sp.]MCP5389701.1 EAL domain-containing protein [Novosphingobium sp.]
MTAAPLPFAALDRDALTGLIGPEAAAVRLDGWDAKARESGRIAPVHVMMLGLRRFETVNLAFGEEAGDSALVEVATRIQHFAQEELEGDWLAARLSGGNFLLALNESCSRERWQWLAETLADLVARPILNTCSAGTMRLWPRIALVRAMPGEGADNLLARLAETLARTQRQAGSRVQWADGDMGLIGRSAQQMEADLLGALDRDEIEILYQPQYALPDDRLVGAEALARWQHPELGRIGASALFAIAERADHVAQLSHHIATRALAGAATWPEPLRLSLNITPADLAASSFANSIAAAVVEADFSPDRLTLEITEEALLTDLDRSASGLAKLRDIGIRIALDDFGAGFCNFRYLKLLPLHYLKLDRVMVDDIVDDPRDLAVFRAILTMAQALGLKVIAEGIENEDQRALIAREGCDYYQGFLRAQPMSAEDFAALTG